MKINIPNTMWEGLSGVLPPIAQKIFQGINKLERYTIEETYATEVKNLSSKGFPAAKTREGYSMVGSFLPA